MAGTMTEIVELDASHDAALWTFWDIEQAAQRAERPDAVLRPFAQLEQMVRRPSPWNTRTFLVAYDGGRAVGTADLGLPSQDNRHLAEIEVNVLPEFRRRGIGRVLHDEAARRARADRRTTVLGEATSPPDGSSSGSQAFAETLGFGVVHREDHLVLDLPTSVDAPAPSADGYEVLSWGNRVPDDLVEAYAALQTQMAADVPMGGVDAEPVVWDVGRVRQSEDRRTAYDLLAAAVRHRADGRLAGYTLLYLRAASTTPSRTTRS